MTTLADRLLPALDPSAGHATLRRTAAGVVDRVVGHDLAVWATVDPATAMTTSCVLHGADRDPALEAEVFAHEYGAEPEVLRFSDLLAGPLIDTVHRATDGDPARSARHRETLAPRGFTDHLRLVLHDGRTPWGAVELLRADGVFTAEEVAALAAVSRPVAVALREALLGARATGAADAALAPLEVDGSGLVLCGSDGRVFDVSDEARALLGAADGDVRLPPVVAALVAGRRGAAPATRTVHAPTADGRWLSFTATALGGRVAVVVDPIRPGRLAELVARARGLSGREQDVLAQLALGRSNRRIARALGLSEWTVQDHVKAVLAKFGVSGRAELQAALFLGAYADLHDGG
ncbi:helix-turn-helix transcriptional regulator [Actinomycetospora sp. NBRC 106375]|uniref:helix-turn-helix transcriptional regulator n=1 Tax=Actinomycetospora sp. NBRC 106375 TaxID=3032207 RepID=UPI0024A18253|nr:helix-turn-helix transcriptional regulator [Actinomycetospora sp. NBRC 106375]GLZ45583.1 helix-turn-helix transcriptional regulator [Actinomycetospora sp. NBRC 106375]